MGIAEIAQPSRRRRARVLVGLGVLVVAAIGFLLVRTIQAGLDARNGRADLERAAAALRSQHVDQARADFQAARREFRSAHDALHGTGPLLSIAHAVPLVRVQYRGLETMSNVGELLSTAGVRLADASGSLLAARDAHVPLSESLAKLRTVEFATRDAVSALAQARKDTTSLDGYRLLGPLDGTRSRLEHQLSSTEPRARTADDGMRLLLWVIGADAPHRLLVFSQNPDEVRPTGGFLGTYGLMEGVGGHVTLSQYGDINQWVAAHPSVALPRSESPDAFAFASPPERQGLANINAGPDWPTDADLAMRLWSRAGEPRVDGVVSLMPQTLARLLRVLGPIRVPSFGETVNADNLLDRLNYYTHREAVQGDPNRKHFIVVLSHIVIRRLLQAPSSSWLNLGKAMAASFDAGETLLWADDPTTQSLLRSLGWAGQFPSAAGDFYDEAEFEYAAKNGHGLVRTFDHVVSLSANGSGTSTTTMTLKNTLPPEPRLVHFNDDSLSFITPYGPKFCTLGPGSDRTDAGEPPLAGHPTAGYLRAAQPLGSTSLHVTFQCPVLALRRTDGSLLYTLDFRDQPGHLGDILHLSVHLPPGFSWAGPAPPSTVRLAGEFRGAWVLQHSP